LIVLASIFLFDVATRRRLRGLGHGTHKERDIDRSIT
jgi:hypothetical protein